MNSFSAIPGDAAGTVQLTADAAAPASIVSRALLTTAEARVTFFSFAAGQELTAHTNARRALVQILSGACDFFYAGEWQRLAAGTLLHLPPHHPHAVRASEPFTMLLTLCGEPIPASSSS
ncbi:MAG TPA: cupin domain-containing protein [Opitutus sp.]|nr:cupin domain-containing protein [Opitutus sp.]